jgi:hypothetical protein
MGIDLTSDVETGLPALRTKIHNQSGDFGSSSQALLQRDKCTKLVVQYSYDVSGNRITQIQDARGPNSVQHDAAGNITGDGINSYSYSGRMSALIATVAAY